MEHECVGRGKKWWKILSNELPCILIFLSTQKPNPFFCGSCFTISANHSFCLYGSLVSFPSQWILRGTRRKWMIIKGKERKRGVCL